MTGKRPLDPAWDYEHVCQPGEGWPAGRAAALSMLTRGPFRLMAIACVVVVLAGIAGGFPFYIWIAVSMVPAMFVLMAVSVARKVALTLMPPGAIHRAAYLSDEIAVEHPGGKFQVGYDMFTAVGERSACILVFGRGIDVLVLSHGICPADEVERLRSAIDAHR